MKKLSFKQPSTNCIYIIPGAPKTSLLFFHATITSQERSLLENNKNPTNIKRYKFLHHDSHGHLTNTKDSPTGHYMFTICFSHTHSCPGSNLDQNESRHQGKVAETQFFVWKLFLIWYLPHFRSLSPLSISDPPTPHSPQLQPHQPHRRRPFSASDSHRDRNIDRPMRESPSFLEEKPLFTNVSAHRTAQAQDGPRQRPWTCKERTDNVKEKETPPVYKHR